MHRFDARELILFKSALKPGGAVYTKLATFLFEGTDFSFWIINNIF